MAKKNYYAVKKGRNTGIFQTWAECRAQVQGYSGAVFKGFEYLEEAEAFLKGCTATAEHKTEGGESREDQEKTIDGNGCPGLGKGGEPSEAKDPTDEGTVCSDEWRSCIRQELVCTDPACRMDQDSAMAYVDGSYDHTQREFSCGVVFFWNGREFHLSRRYRDPELAAMRNVAGEIKGSELAMRCAASLGVGRLAIYHDYQGIASWCTGEWQARKEGTAQYRAFYQRAARQMEITFCKVKGHSGVVYNELADQLAKEALGLA